MPLYFNQIVFRCHINHDIDLQIQVIWMHTSLGLKYRQQQNNVHKATNSSS